MRGFFLEGKLHLLDACVFVLLSAQIRLFVV
jgi:hypothetical protein